MSDCYSRVHPRSSQQDLSLPLSTYASVQGRRESKRKIYDKELAHRIMGAEKSQDLQAGDPGEPMTKVPV